ncbi:MAG TPA: hypothetical protein VHJ20_05945 [Polyangia bacterium]|nr:hypothetical protein [Polyangia bacterium]
MRPLAILGFWACGVWACSSPGGGGGPSGGGSGGTTSPGGGGATASGGDTGAQGGQPGSGGTTTGGGGSTASSGGTGGSVFTGSGGTTSAGGTTGGGGTTSAGGTTGAGGSADDVGDLAPYRPLHITATKAQHTHGSAGVDTRAPSLGKLAVTLGVSGGGYSQWLGKRGYHVIGASFGECNAPNLGAGRDAVGTCRLGEWMMIKTQVTATLKSLAASNPEEDWGYFFTDATMNDVRWSDVAFTGVSHGATTAEIIARLGARVWRAVSCAGPRDNTCGTGAGTAPFDPAHPPYDPNCPDSKIASWLDKPSLTPMSRYYALVGTTDVEYGDIMFNMERTKYPGAPVQWNTPTAVLTGTNRFISSEGGHLDFLNAADDVKPMRTDEVLNIAFGIPPANQHPAF